MKIKVYINIFITFIRNMYYFSDIFATKKQQKKIKNKEKYLKTNKSIK